MIEAEDRLIYLVTSTARLLTNHLRDRLRAAGVEITSSQVAMMFLLDKSRGLSMTEISRAVVADNAAVTRLVDRLEKAGLVRRTADPGDRRVSMIVLTDRGRRETEAAAKVVRSLNREIRESMTTAELEVFAGTMIGLAARLRGGD
ncbi:MAG: MarR family transcriptional regulator [Proteobacteria bacterium]|nr:MarR family transcriptional regulator [Pseudomonadota bacterium]MBU1740564.1 MarR family transcriptional regulator [Pseudomonadota bacterium]